MDWLIENIDWPMLLVAFGLLLHSRYTKHLTKGIKHMAGEMDALNAEVTRLGVVAGEAVAKMNALMATVGAGIDPAAVVAATEAMKVAVDSVAAIVEAPVPAAGSTPAAPVADATPAA